jgi:hypothetical protein
MTKQMKDGLQSWMDKHLVVMTLSDDKKQEKKIEKTIEMKCLRCGFEHKLEVEGLESFFG